MAFPIAAALLTAGFIYIEPEKYQATATVTLPVVLPHAQTFVGLLKSAPVVDQVSKESGESKSDLVAGLSATATTNYVILVTYVGSNKTTVQVVVHDAALDAVDALLGPQVRATARELLIADHNLADFTMKDQPGIVGLTAVITQRNVMLARLEQQVVQLKSLEQALIAAQADTTELWSTKLGEGFGRRQPRRVRSDRPRNSSLRRRHSRRGHAPIAWVHCLYRGPQPAPRPQP